MIKITANGVCARAQRLEPLTSGMVGTKVAFDLSPDFDGLTVTAVFTNGAVTKDVLNPGAECFIPPEVLATAGKTVKVGIYAVSGSELVIPTVYAPIGVVLPGADPSGDTSTGATLPVWAQIEAMIGSLDDLTTEAKNNLVAAINEAAQTGGGSASIAMRVDGGYIQYSTDNGNTWVNLIAKADLKGDKGADGKDGVDGYSPTASVTKTGKTATITITDKSRTTTATVADGQDGYTPIKGVDYFDGTNGITPHIGDNGNWYLGDTDTGKPSRGATGAKGGKGDKGDTPVKGTDYWTASDKAEVVAEAAAAIDLTPYAKKTEVPVKTSQLTNDSGFLTSHQDISGKQDKSTLEADVAAKGFTKNTGTYSKPDGGIPKSDLAEAVQTSLGKADTALQEHQSLAAYRTAAEQTIIDVGKQDKLIAGKNITIASDGKTISATGGSEALIVPITESNGTLSVDKTFIEIRDAIVAGIPVLVNYAGTALPLITLTADALYFGTFQCDSGDATNGAVVATVMIEITLNGEVNDFSAQVDIPKTLPNPNAITFTGAVTGSYDGSTAKTVNIPSAVTDAHINSLIDTKLGVIENGSY